MADKSFFDNISATDYITLENTRDNHESLFTILINNTSKEIFLKDLNERLKKIQEIKNSFKKKKLNDRLYKFIQKIELDNKDIYNNVFLVSDDILSFTLTKKDYIILKEWNINNYMFIYDEYFNCEFEFNTYMMIINYLNDYVSITVLQHDNEYKPKIINIIGSDNIYNINR